LIGIEMNKLEQFQENIQRLSDLAGHYEALEDDCGLGAAKVFPIPGGSAHVWLLHERETVSIVKSYVTPNSEFPVHSHFAREIIVLFEGRATYESGDVVKELKPGDCVSVEPNKPHRMLTHEEGAWFSVTTVPREEALGDGR
jgi:quercetin dioxygenase-like cupin family protein